MSDPKAYAERAWRRAVRAINYLELECDPAVIDELKSEVYVWPELKQIHKLSGFRLEGKMDPSGINHIIFNTQFDFNDIREKECTDGMSDHEKEIHTLPPLSSDKEVRSKWADLIAKEAIVRHASWIYGEGKFSEKILKRAKYLAKRDFGVEQFNPEEKYILAALRERIMDSLQKYLD